MFELFFKYDDTWTYTELLYLTQTIQRILGLKESLVVSRQNNEVVFDFKIETLEDAKKLLDKIYKTIIMVEPYTIGYRRIIR